MRISLGIGYKVVCDVRNTCDFKALQKLQKHAMTSLLESYHAFNFRILFQIISNSFRRIW